MTQMAISHKVDADEVLLGRHCGLWVTGELEGVEGFALSELVE